MSHNILKCFKKVTKSEVSKKKKFRKIGQIVNILINVWDELQSNVWISPLWHQCVNSFIKSKDRRKEVIVLNYTIGVSPLWHQSVVNN